MLFVGCETGGWSYLSLWGRVLFFICSANSVFTVLVGRSSGNVGDCGVGSFLLVMLLKVSDVSTTRGLLSLDKG